MGTNNNQYIDAVRTLTEAVIRRGLVFHQETNLPVYNALKAFAVAVQVRPMDQNLTNIDQR